MERIAILRSIPNAVDPNIFEPRKKIAYSIIDRIHGPGLIQSCAQWGSQSKMEWRRSSRSITALPAGCTCWVVSPRGRP